MKKALTTVIAKGAIVLLPLILAGCCGCFAWEEKLPCGPCECPQPLYCGYQPIDYCSPDYYEYFDAN